MSDVQKVSVALTGEQVAALRRAVEMGEYATTSEAIREALREWQWKRDLRNEDLKRLRAQWRKGKASGSSQAVDFAGTSDEARRRLTKAARRSA